MTDTAVSPLMGLKATVEQVQTYQLAKAYYLWAGRVVNVFHHKGETWVGILTGAGLVIDLPASCFRFEAE
jgi:hypothetical protein